MRRALRALALGMSLAFAHAADAAETSAAETGLTTPERIEAAFLRGLGLLEAGEPREAAILFRRILADDPTLPRVRLELARAYFQMQSWPEARAEFVAVLSAGVPSEVKQTILRFINAIDARRGFDWNAAIGIASGPEAGRSYDTDIVRLDFLGTVLPFEVDRPENEPLGAIFEGGAEIRRAIGELGDAAMVGFLSASADIFDAPGARSDDYIFGAAGGSRFVWPQTTAFLAANAGLRQKGGEIFEDSFGFRGAVEYRTASGYAPSFAVSYAKINNHRAPARDRDLHRFSLGLAKSVFGAATIGAAASFERSDARKAYESYDSLGLSLFGRVDLGFGLNATMRAAVQRDQYEGKAPLFVDKRRDLNFAVDLEIVKNDILLLKNFSPFIGVGYSRNDSTIGIYSFDEYRFRIGVRNSF